MAEFRVLVCGGRNYGGLPEERNRLESVMDSLARSTDRPIVIVHGGARGADELAGAYVRRTYSEHGGRLSEDRYPADWERYGKRAGHLRNTQMIIEGAPDLVLAFPGGKGTENMIRQAKEAGIPVRIYRDP